MIRKEFLIALLTLLSVTGTTAAQADTSRTSVIGGTVVAHGSFPYMAFVTSEEAACSGTVVSSNLILTAAHCATEAGEVLDPSGFTVTTGNVDRTSPERVVSGVSRVLVYPGYIDEGEYEFWGDAALLQLSVPITAPPIKVATSAFWKGGTEALIAGWGKTTPAQVGPSAAISYATTVVQNTQFCQGEVGPTFHPVAELCSLDYPSYKSGTCNGDSGGPMLALNPSNELVQIAITSHGFEGCPLNQPRIDTRADFVSGWVNNRVAELAPPPPPVVKPVARPVAKAPAPPTLPTLTSNAAKGFTRQALREGMGGHFNLHRKAYRVACAEVEATKQNCAVSWIGGASNYWGHVTIYYDFEGAAVVWKDHFQIRKVNSYCYFYSGRRSTCKITQYRL
jgi:secreted trypsin-like serine protease